MRDGDVGLALTAPEGTIADAAAGGPLRVAAGRINRPPLSLIALSRHWTVADLRGGLIGTSSLKEGTRHVAERMLAAHGLAYPADYEWALEGSHIERWKALQAGTIDAALQMIPYDYIAEEAGFTNLGPVTEDFAFNAVCVRRDIDPALLTRFLRALAQATLWFRGNVAEAAAIAAAETSAENRHALRACRALAAGGVIPDDLRVGRAAFDAAVESLRLSGAGWPRITAILELRSITGVWRLPCSETLRQEPGHDRCCRRRGRPRRHVARRGTAPGWRPAGCARTAGRSGPPRSKALTLYPRTVELFAMRGIADRWLDEGTQVPTSHFAMLTSRLDFSHPRHPVPVHACSSLQLRTEQLLEEHLASLGVPYLQGRHAVTGLRQDAEGVDV